MELDRLKSEDSIANGVHSPKGGESKQPEPGVEHGRTPKKHEIWRTILGTMSTHDPVNICEWVGPFLRDRWSPGLVGGFKNSGPTPSH